MLAAPATMFAGDPAMRAIQRRLSTNEARPGVCLLTFIDARLQTMLVNTVAEANESRVLLTGPDVM